jgi:hypothetical protein
MCNLRCLCLLLRQLPNVSSMLVMSLSFARTVLLILVENFHTLWMFAESMKSWFRREASPTNGLMTTLLITLRSTAIDVARRVITLLLARTPRIHMLGEAKAAGGAIREVEAVQDVVAGLTI